MSEQIACPVCGKTYEWQPAMQMTRMRCTGCGLMLALPDNPDGMVDLASDVIGQDLPEYEPVIGVGNIDPYAELNGGSRSPIPEQPHATDAEPPVPPVPPAPPEALTPDASPPSTSPLQSNDDDPPMQLADDDDDDVVMELSDEDEVMELSDDDVVEDDGQLELSPLQPLPPSGSQAGMPAQAANDADDPQTSMRAGAEPEEDEYSLAIDPEPAKPASPLHQPMAPKAQVLEEADMDEEEMAGASETLKRVQRQMQAREEEELLELRKQKMEDIYIPLGLIGTGLFFFLITVLFIVDVSPFQAEFGITVGTVKTAEFISFFIFIALQLPFMFGGLFFIARLFGTSFGLIQIAILKIVSISIFASSVDLLVEWLLFHVTEGLPVPTGMVRMPFLVVAFGAPCFKLLEMDILETFVFFLIVYMLPFFVMFMFAATLFSMLS